MAEQHGDKHFRKRPVVVEAVQWHKQGDHAAVQPLRRPDPIDCELCGHPYKVHGAIRTLEDTDSMGHLVCPADWVIKGVKGEHYACKPNIFALTYEPASTPSSIVALDETPRTDRNVIHLVAGKEVYDDLEIVTADFARLLEHEYNHLLRTELTFDEAVAKEVAARSAIGELEHQLSEARHNERLADDAMAREDERYKGWIPPLTELERVTLTNLVGVARYVYVALDDGAEELPDGSLQIDEAHSNSIALAIACLDELPDDRPGVTMCPSAKAEWALRRIIGTTDDTAKT